MGNKVPATSRMAGKAAKVGPRQLKHGSIVIFVVPGIALDDYDGGEFARVQK